MCETYKNPFYQDIFKLINKHFIDNELSLAYTLIHMKV